MISAQTQEYQSYRSRSSGWLSEMLLIDGEEYFPALLHEISMAKKSIYLEAYIFEHEKIGKELIRALNSACERGVTVHLLVDGVGSSSWISSAFDSDTKLDFETRVYHPLPWQLLPGLGTPRGPGVAWIFQLFGYVNSRNHRKIAIVDERVAFVGSLNISDVHLKKIAGKNAWHDVGVRVEGDACEVLLDAYLSAWFRSWRLGEKGILRPSLQLRGRREKKSHPLVVRNDGRILRHRALSQRLRMIRQARERVWIANAYFVPSGPLLRALVAAAARGVDVRLLLPSSSDVNFMPWVARAFYSALVKRGVRLFEYQPGILHAKLMYVDNVVTVGSSNLNHRSLLHDFELDVIVSDETTIARVKRMFEEDFLMSKEIENHSLESAPLWKGLLVKFLLYFRHVL